MSDEIRYSKDHEWVRIDADGHAVIGVTDFAAGQLGDVVYVDLPAVGDDGTTHGWHLYVLRLRDDAPVDRDAFIEGMAELGVGCSVHFIPLHLQPYWRDSLDLSPGDYPTASHEFTRVVSLPAFSSMTDDQVERVVTAARSLLT